MFMFKYVSKYMLFTEIYFIHGNKVVFASCTCSSSDNSHIAVVTIVIYLVVTIVI